MSITTVNNMLACTTTRVVQFYPEDEFSRCFWTWQAQLQFPHLQTQWYSDTLDATIKSIHGNKYGQLFCNDEDWAAVVPMCSKADCGDTFNQVREYSIPELGIHMDNASRELGTFTEWEKTQKHFLIKQTFIEPYSPWMNRAEGEI